MDQLNDDCLINIFSQLQFLQKIRLEFVCRRWFHILRGHAVHSKMQNLNLADYVRENRLIELSNGNEGRILVEQTLGGILNRAGPFVQQIDFNHRWPTISSNVIQKIADCCSQLTKLDMGWVRFDADLSPILDKIAEQLVEFSLEESSWNGDRLAEKVPTFFERMRNLKRLNLRKFVAPLNDLVKLEGGKLEFLDVSEATQLSSDILIQFLGKNPQLLSLHLCPMPHQCLSIVADSTTSAFNRPGPFLGFVQQKTTRKMPFKGPKKGADLQAIIIQLSKMPWLRTLWIGHIFYSSHFLKLDAIGEIAELRHLHLKDINSLVGNALKTILPGLRDHIRQLSLLNCTQLDDFSPLPICAFLTQLDIEGGKKLTDECIQGLAQHGRLKIVRINCCPKVSNAAIWSIVEKCPLKELELIKCSSISTNLFANNESFKKCEKLERFSLSGCEGITNQSIVDAVNEANIWGNIQQLDLSRNMNLDDSSLGMVKEVVERMKDKRNGKTLIVYCTGTGISQEPIGRFEPFIELAFY